MEIQTENQITTPANDIKQMGSWVPCDYSDEIYICSICGAYDNHDDKLDTCPKFNSAMLPF